MTAPEADIPPLHRQIARNAFPNGAWLRCHNPACDRGEKVTSVEAAHYLATGWPSHCGQTMQLVNVEDRS